ncbi:MAG: tRNA epoxyqueuosine(34) reductase QueG [Bacteroidales bacterium]|nr:tRNA epoxyqueuosine(34) reductase QueG [Bacteroidales bacterium]
MDELLPGEIENLRQNIIKWAKELGFDDVGFSEADLLNEQALFVEQWLDKQYQGTMSYLERNREKRYDPRLLVENTRTILSVLQNYFPSENLTVEDNYKISKYAYGADYHSLIRNKLRILLSKIESVTGPLQARAFTDSAPVLDRAWAEKGGLGFIGKNTCLIHPRKGSFFFIGHLFLPIRLATPAAKPVTDYCGTCRRCIDACPTNALIAPHQLDARRCISYLTIEYRGDLPGELRNRFKDWIFGCDICQDVCPWNRFAKPHHEPLFALSDELKKMRKSDWHRLDANDFKRLFKGTAVERTRFDGLKRNIRFLENESDESLDTD